MKVVREQFALRRRYSRLKEGLSHTKSRSQGGEENLQTRIRGKHSKSPWKGGDSAEHQDDCRETVPTIEKIEKIEANQSQFSCQMADVQSNRNDECL